MATPQSPEFAGRHARAVLGIKTLQNSLEWWYSTKVAAFRSSSGAQLTQQEDTSPRRPGNEELLLAVVTCVANALMIKLDVLLCCLASGHDGIMNIAYHDRALLGRQRTMFESLDFVRARSLIAAKPLEFGLKQIWLDAGLRPGSTAQG